jgi:hypothetical protein
MNIQEALDKRCKLLEKRFSQGLSQEESTEFDVLTNIILTQTTEIELVLTKSVEDWLLLLEREET